MAFVWDERTRQANLLKHGLDFEDAHLVYNDPQKLTFGSRRRSEERRVDIAWVPIAGRTLVLIYTERGGDIRVISFRIASRTEREIYEYWQESQ